MTLTGLAPTAEAIQPPAPIMGQWRSNTDLAAEQTAMVDSRVEMMQRQNTPMVLGLAAYFRTLWEAARDHKQRIVEPRLLQCLLARKGEYSGAQLQQISDEGGVPIYMMLTDEKCANLEAWLHDIFDQPGEPPFGAEETPVPELEEALVAELHQAAQGQVQAASISMVELEIAMGGIRDEAAAQQRLAAIMQEQMSDLEDDLSEVLHEEAKKQTERMVEAVKDVAKESKWMGALLESLSDFSTYPDSFLRGPCVVNKSVMEWQDGKPLLVRKAVTSWAAPSPWDIFPGSENRDCQDGHLIERHYLSSKSLADLIGVEGYDSDAIRSVIREQTGGGLRSTWLDTTNEATRQQLEGRDRIANNPEPLIPALQIWADVPGFKLIEHGMHDGQITDATKHYPVEAWLIGQWVIKCQLNPSPDGQRPYFKAGFREVKGSFWDRALPEVISDSQSQCNVAARALARNVGVASGPQVGVDVGAIATGDKIDEVHPYKIWQFDLSSYLGGGSGSRQPLWFFQPQLLAAELLKLYEFWNGEADTKSGIPRYANGGTGGQQGALGTASGFAMMLDGASKGIKRVAKSIDVYQIEPSIQRIILDILLKEPGKYRGDVKIQAVGSTALLNKGALQVRRGEAITSLRGDAAAQEIIGREGYAEVLREYFKGLEFKNIVPSKRTLQMQAKQQELAATMEQQAMASAPQQPEKPRTVNPDGGVQGDAALMQGGS